MKKHLNDSWYVEEINSFSSDYRRRFLYDEKTAAEPEVEQANWDETPKVTDWPLENQEMNESGRNTGEFIAFPESKSVENSRIAAGWRSAVAALPLRTSFFAPVISEIEEDSVKSELGVYSLVAASGNPGDAENVAFVESAVSGENDVEVIDSPASAVAEEDGENDVEVVDSPSSAVTKEDGDDTVVDSPSSAVTEEDGDDTVVDSPSSAVTEEDGGRDAAVIDSGVPSVTEDASASSDNSTDVIASDSDVTSPASEDFQVLLAQYEVPDSTEIVYIADDAAYVDQRSGAPAGSYYAILVGTYTRTIYGGSATADLSSTSRVTIDVEAGAVLGGNLYGGGDGYRSGAIELNIKGGTFGGYIYGGGHNGSTLGDVAINVTGGVIHNLVGGALENGESNISSHTVTITIDDFTAAKSNSYIIGGGMDFSTSGGGVQVNSVVIVVNGGSASYLHGGGYALGASTRADTNSIDITINGGTFSGYVYGGGRGSGTEAQAAAGGVTMRITGGTFTCVFGGGYSSNGARVDVHGQISITVSGGTFSGGIYGGSQQDGKSNSQVLAVNITIDVSGSNVVNMGNGAVISTGGSSNTNVYGNTSLTLTGTGSNLRTAGGTFSGWLKAGASASNYTNTLRFRDYTDAAFQAHICPSFNHLEFSGGTSVTVVSAISWEDGMNYDFSLTGRNSSLFGTAFLSQGTGSLGITAQSKFTITLSDAEIAAAGGNFGSFDLVDAMDGAWAFADNSVSLTYNDGGTAYSGTGKFGSADNVISLGGVQFTLVYDSGILRLDWATAARSIEEPLEKTQGMLA